jgi:hypothetical protein
MTAWCHGYQKPVCEPSAKCIESVRGRGVKCRNGAPRCFLWVAGIRSLAASAGQPTPDFARALNAMEVTPDQPLRVVRAGYIHSLFRAALGRMRPPNPGAKNHLIGRPRERVCGRVCEWSGLFEDAGGIPACSRCVERQRHHR